MILADYFSKVKFDMTTLLALAHPAKPIIFEYVATSVVTLAKNRNYTLTFVHHIIGTNIVILAQTQIWQRIMPRYLPP